MSSSNHAILHTGAKMPLLGLGTWKSKADQIENAVVSAIKMGYRHLDCAAVYGNECDVGKALTKALALTGVKREEMFITSKLWNTMHAPEDVMPAVQKTLADLQLDYLDLYLIHNPYGFANKDGQMMPKNPDGSVMYSSVHYCDTWKAMEGLVDKGLCRAIGLSNFNHKQILDVMEKGRIKPAVLQVECNPFFRQQELIDFCHSHGIVVTAYSPLCCGDRAWKFASDPDLYGDPKLTEIAKKHRKTIAQIALRFQVQRGVVTVPKSVTPKWIEENSQIFDFNLTQEDMEMISTLRTHRMANPPAKGADNKPLQDNHGNSIPRDKDHPFYPYNEPF